MGRICSTNEEMKNTHKNVPGKTKWGFGVVNGRIKSDPK
jgi:hypothetical protein